jgi:hypothetical protein
MTKNIKFLKLSFFKNCSVEGGALKEAIKHKQPNEIIIHSQTKKNGRCWTSTTPENLLQILHKNNGLYEVITTYPHKVYFDIDNDDKPDPTFKDKIIDKINELFPNPDIAISGSTTEDKTSYHIILNNYLIRNEKERDYIKSIVKYLNQHIDKSFDWKVYTNNRNMKIINQSKDDGRVQEIIYNQDTKKHLICSFFNTEILELPKFIKPEEEQIKLIIDVDNAYKTFDLGQLPKFKLELPDKFDINETTPEQILQLLPLNKTFNHNYTHLIARFCYHNNLSFNIFYNWYQQKSDTEKNKLKWIKHFEKIHNFPPVKIKAITTILVKYYPTIKREKAQQNFMNLFETDINKTIKVETLTQDIFNLEEKFTIINTGMGSGKTFQTLKYLIDKPSFIWITPLEALAQNTKFRLEQDNIECKYYKDFKNSKEKHERMAIYDKLIICINSLPYTKDKKFKVVVIDEIETLLGKWFNNDTLNNKCFLKSDCWKRFIDIIQNADKVIFLDAFTSKITTNFINSLGNGEYKIVERLKEDTTRTIKFMSNYYSWLDDIMKKIKDNKKIFMFYPYLRANNGLPSMEELKVIIEKQTNKTGVCYNSQVDDETLNGLKDVNSSWSKVDFVITNTKITVGINYELDYFDKVYLSIAGFSSARDLIQVSYRCRKLKSNTIKVCYIDKSNTLNAFRNDDKLVEGCEIYKSLVSDILIEKKAPLKQSFLFMCDKANYKITAGVEAIDGSLESYFKKLFDETNLGYSYNSIPIIQPEDVETIQNRICGLCASIEDKITIKKYYYIKKFKESAKDNEYLQIGWDNRYDFFFDRINELAFEENNIFNKIKDFNKWNSIFPDDKSLSKVKLNEELINQIFNEFHFKNVSKISGHLCIIKNIYNTFFNKKIISSTQDGNNNYKSSISDEIKDLYEFGLNELKLFNYTNKVEISSVVDIFNDE